MHLQIPLAVEIDAVIQPVEEIVKRILSGRKSGPELRVHCGYFISGSGGRRRARVPVRYQPYAVQRNGHRRVRACGLQSLCPYQALRASKQLVADVTPSCPNPLRHTMKVQGGGSTRSHRTKIVCATLVCAAALTAVFPTYQLSDHPRAGLRKWIRTGCGGSGTLRARSVRLLTIRSSDESVRYSHWTLGLVPRY